MFNVVQSSKNYVLEDNKTPKPLGARVVSNGLGAYKVFIESFFVEISKRAHSIGNRALRVRVVSYALGAYKVFIESFVVEISKRAHSIGN